MMKVSISGLIIEIIHSGFLDIDTYKPFLYFGDKAPDIRLEIEGHRKVERPRGSFILDEKLKWIKDFERDNTLSVYVPKENPNEVAYLLDVDNKWEKAKIIYQEGSFSEECAASGPLAEILFRNALLFHKGLVLHASAIQLDGKGILFSAPSETGKTTQARLWCQEKGATLINNDRPAIRVIGNKPYIYGTPWSGTVSECNNNDSQLDAIVMLEQAGSNSIYELSISEAIPRLMPRCFLPYVEAYLMKIAIGNLEEILKRTPVYLLKCKPDVEAVELVYKTVWRNRK